MGKDILFFQKIDHYLIIRDWDYKFFSRANSIVKLQEGRRYKDLLLISENFRNDTQSIYLILDWLINEGVKFEYLLVLPSRSFINVEKMLFELYFPSPIFDLRINCSQRNQTLFLASKDFIGELVSTWKKEQIDLLPISQLICEYFEVPQFSRSLYTQCKDSSHPSLIYMNCTLAQLKRAMNNWIFDKSIHKIRPIDEPEESCFETPKFDKIPKYLSPHLWKRNINCKQPICQPHQQLIHREYHNRTDEWGIVYKVKSEYAVVFDREVNFTK